MMRRWDGFGVEYRKRKSQTRGRHVPASAIPILPYLGRRNASDGRIRGGIRQVPSTSRMSRPERWFDFIRLAADNSSQRGREFRAAARVSVAQTHRRRFPMACFRASGHRSCVRIFIGLSTAGALIAGGAGCDRSASQADQRVNQAVDEALPQLGGSEANRNAAASLLTAANGEANASLPSRIRAKEALAQSELRIAEQMLPKI